MLAGFTAVDFGTLVDQNYMISEPDSFNRKSGKYANYLWLFEKANATGTTGQNASRNVALFKLIVGKKIAQEKLTFSLPANASCLFRGFYA